MVAYAQDVLIELGVINTGADDDDVIGGEVGILLLAERRNIDGVNLGVGGDQGVDELLGVAVVFGPVEDDRSWIHGRAFRDERVGVVGRAGPCPRRLRVDGRANRRWMNQLRQLVLK